MRILGRAFPTFQRLLQFPQGLITAPQEFDITAPVQPVYDLSRQNELQAGSFGGYGNFSIVNTHGAADTQRNSFNFGTTNLQTRVGFDPSNYWLWLTEVTVKSPTAAILSAAYLAIKQIDNRAEWQDHTRLIAMWNVMGGAGGSGATIDGTDFGAMNNITNLAGGMLSPYLVQFPVLIPLPDALVHFTTVSTAAAVITAHCQVQAVPRGVGPLGLR